MHVMQALNLIYLVAHCREIDPLVHIQMINSTCIRITHNWESRYYLTDKKVLWPGLASVDDFGKIQLVLRKEKDEMWDPRRAIVTYYQGLLPLKIPDYYSTVVIEKRKLNENLYLLRLQKKINVWAPVGIGRHFFVKQTIDGKEILQPYNHVPIFPISNLSYPNAKPGEFVSCNEPVNLIVKSYRQGIVSQWLAKREVGDEVIISNPQGNFNKIFLDGATYVYLIAAGTGITPMLSILLWVLQSSRALVRLVSFNELEEDLTWQNEIQELQSMEERFRATFIVSNATYDWHGKVGRATPKLMENVIPIEKNNSMSFFCVCGPPSFQDRIVAHITVYLRFPRERIYLFDGFEHDRYAMPDLPYRTKVSDKY